MKISLYAPNKQQIEGLRSTLTTVSFQTFLLAIERLTAAKMMSKSRKHLLIKRARHILGISYRDYLTQYKPLVPHFSEEDMRYMLTPWEQRCLPK